MRPNLVAVPDSGLYDLPPRWDGHPVIWRGWKSMEVSPCPGIREACESCGSLDAPTTNVGLVGEDPAMTHADVEHDDQAMKLARSMRARRKSRSCLRLTAFRCVECGADTVVDDKRDAWTLDRSDYGEVGSTDPRLFDPAEGGTR